MGFFPYDNPKYAFAYNNRGNAKYKQKDFKGAVTDYDKAIELNPAYGFAYLNRGIAKEMLRDSKGACTDWKKSAELGVSNASNYVKQQCN